MKIHKIPIQSEMRVYEDNLNYLPDFKTFNQELKKEILKCGDQQKQQTAVVGTMTYWDMQNRSENFRKLLKIVGDKLYKLIDLRTSEGFVQLVCMDMWGVIHRKGEWTKHHTHLGNQYSFAYYIQAPKDCSPIVYSTPGSLEVHPTNGTLLLWESSYTHHTYKNKTKELRVMISGNLGWKTTEHVQN
tara:strand:+ start:2442 stop:3002 length:561 start_codon:yes stop_codon:yes gene_type:complete